MNPWFAGALRWTDRVDHACGVLLAGGVAQPDPALEDLLAALLPDALRLGADEGATRIRAFDAALAAARAEPGRETGHAVWAATHALLGWTARYRRRIQHAALRASLGRAEGPAESLRADTEIAVVGVLPSGKRWFVHGRTDAGERVVLVDHVQGDGWRTPVISALFQARIVPAEVYGGVLRLPSGHPTETTGGRIVVRPAFSSRPQVVAGVLRPDPRPDAERGRVRAVRAGPDLVSTFDRRPLATGEIATWNLWKAAGSTGFEAWGWTANGALVGLEGELGPVFVAADPAALRAVDFGAPPLPDDLGDRVAAALGGAFGAVWRDRGAWDGLFAGSTRDADVATAAGRLLGLVARGGAGVEEVLAAALGRIARGHASALEILALDLASPGAAASVPPERLRAVARAATDDDRPWVVWLFARAGRADDLGVG